MTDPTTPEPAETAIEEIASQPEDHRTDHVELIGDDAPDTLDQVQEEEA